MKLRLLALLLGSCSLAACGGGGSGSNPIPVPSHAPAAHSVSFGLTRIADIGRHAASITKQSACGLNPPNVNLQALPTSAPPSGALQSYEAGYVVVATEFDATCTAVNSTPTFSVMDPSVASLTVPSWIPNVPTPGVGQVNVAGVSAGNTTLIATFPDGTTATVPVAVYGTMGVTCASNTYYTFTGTAGYATSGWSVTGPIPSTSVNACQYNTSNAVQGDMQDDNNGNIVFPYGYQIVSNTQGDPANALAAYPNCASFASQGTTISSAQIQSTPIGVLLFKTQSGRCVKFSPEPNEQLAQNGSVTLVGLYEISDNAGFFLY